MEPRRPWTFNRGLTGPFSSRFAIKRYFRQFFRSRPTVCWPNAQISRLRHSTRPPISARWHTARSTGPLARIRSPRPINDLRLGDADGAEWSSLDWRARGGELATGSPFSPPTSGCPRLGYGASSWFFSSTRGAARYTTSSPAPSSSGFVRGLRLIGPSEPDDAGRLMSSPSVRRLGEGHLTGSLFRRILGASSDSREGARRTLPSPGLPGVISVMTGDGMPETESEVRTTPLASAATTPMTSSRQTSSTRRTAGPTGLPIVPPTEALVRACLDRARLRADEVVGVEPVRRRRITAEKVAIAAVMAGCRGEYMPVVLAVVRAMCAPEFGLHGTTASTGGSAPFIVVNGPIRRAIGMNATHNALANASRANATIGRTSRLVILNVLGGVPGGSIARRSGTPASSPSAWRRTRREPVDASCRRARPCRRVSPR